jgi:hypothetical protein
VRARVYRLSKQRPESSLPFKFLSVDQDRQRCLLSPGCLCRKRPKPRRLPSTVLLSNSHSLARTARARNLGSCQLQVKPTFLTCRPETNYQSPSSESTKFTSL